jgi:putative oxidoreductase
MSTTPNKGLNIGLWITQVLLAALNLMAGSTKLFQPIEEMAKMMPWVAESPAGLVRFIGLSEVLGGIGLLLPSMLRIQPKLTVFAAIGLAIVQLLAMGFHLSRGESAVIGMNIFLIAMAGFIAWGRSKKAPISPK